MKHRTSIRLKWTSEPPQAGAWGEEPDGGADDCTCIRVADFDRTALRVSQDKLTTRSIEAPTRMNLQLRPGDLLIEKSGGGELQPVGAVVLYDLNLPAITSNFVARLRPHREFHSRFICYLHAHVYACRINTKSIKQTTGLQNLDLSQYLDERVSVPDIHQQRTIANFLDRETAKIDDLIAKKQRLLDLLSQEKRSVTFRLVTGAHCPRPKRQPADPRLQPVPEHWTTEKLGYLARLVSGGTPSKENDGFWKGEIPWVSAKDMKTQYLHDSEDHISTEAMSAAALHLLPPSTVLIVVRGMILVHSLPVGILRVPATINQDIKALSFNSKCHPEFMLAWLQGMAYLLHSLVEESAHGTRCLRTDLLKNVVCHLPPLEEQREIVTELNANLAKLDEVTRPITSAIALLREYRSGLISAAVTGQLDLRQHEAQLEALA